jgi:hypothetical protein
MRIKRVLAILPVLFVSSCACPYVYEIDSFQPGDKDKSCNQIVMEINEAEYFRKKATNNKGTKVDYALNPFCYPSGFLSSDRAMRSAEQRLDYLNQIYEMRGCGRNNRDGSSAGTGMGGQGGARPYAMPPQPAPQPEPVHPLEGERPDYNTIPPEPTDSGIGRGEVK